MLCLFVMTITTFADFSGCSLLFAAGKLEENRETEKMGLFAVGSVEANQEAVKMRQCNTSYEMAIQQV